MTIDEYKRMIQSMTPETFQDTGAKLLDELEKDAADTDGYKNRIEELELKNRSLQDTNQNLFLRVTGKPEVKEEKTDAEKLKELLDSI